MVLFDDQNDINNQRGKTLAQAIEKICKPVFASYYGAELFINWRAVVGVKLASVTYPLSISSDKKILTIRVDKRKLLDVQYQTAYILSQVHQYLSDKSIERVRLKTSKKSKS